MRILACLPIAALFVTGLASPALAAPPTVTLTTPAAGAVVKGSIELSATSATATKVEYFIDGTERAEDTSCCEWDEGFNTAGLSEGPHTIYAKATNGDGATSTAARSFTVDNVADTAPAPAPAPAPEPSPAPAPTSTGSKLSWAPPAGHATYPAKNVTSTGFNSVSGGGGDIRIVLPRDKPVGPIQISSCRNVVLIGGAIKVLPSETASGSDQRALYIKGCTGTVHIEGLAIDGNVTGSTADAIAVSAPAATVVLQNVRAIGMRGSANNHADVFQPWGGVKAYKIDRLTGSTNYQGLHVGEDLGEIGSGDVRNTNIFSSGGSGDGGYMFWGPRTAAKSYPLTFTNTYISGRSGDSVNRVLMPNASEPTCPLRISGTAVTWKSTSCSWINGTVTFGKPAADFAPASSVGLGYTSPGYL